MGYIVSIVGIGDAGLAYVWGLLFFDILVSIILI
jgi:hypothetical protein